MIIPDPKANHTDIVFVENYRRRPPVFERGKIMQLSYKNSFGEFYWSYEVAIKRPAPSRGYRLFVGDNQIEKI